MNQIISTTEKYPIFLLHGLNNNLNKTFSFEGEKTNILDSILAINIDKSTTEFVNSNGEDDIIDEIEKGVIDIKERLQNIKEENENIVDKIDQTIENLDSPRDQDLNSIYRVSELHDESYKLSVLIAHLRTYFTILLRGIAKSDQGRQYIILKRELILVFDLLLKIGEDDPVLNPNEDCSFYHSFTELIFKEFLNKCLEFSNINIRNLIELYWQVLTNHKVNNLIDDFWTRFSDYDNITTLENEKIPYLENRARNCISYNLKYIVQFESVGDLYNTKNLEVDLHNIVFKFNLEKAQGKSTFSLSAVHQNGIFHKPSWAKPM